MEPRRPITQLEPYELMSLYDQAFEEPEELAPGEEPPAPPAYKPEELRKEMLRRMNLRLSKKDTSSSFRLQEAQRPKGFQDREIETLLAITYEFKHSTPGRDGTTLSFHIKSTADTANYAETYPNGQPQEVKRVKTQILFSEIETNSIEDGFAKAAEWCRRAADSLETAPQKAKLQIPL